MGKRLDVPYKSQWDADAGVSKDDCGAASLAMDLNYFGLHITTNGIFDLTDSALDYLTADELNKAATTLGYKFICTSGKNIEDLKKCIDMGMPALVVVHYGDLNGRQDKFEGPHIIVVTGYDDKFIYTNDPDFWGTRRDEGKDKAYAINDFIKAWNSTVDKNYPGNLWYIEKPVGWQESQELIPLGDRKIDFYDFEGKQHAVSWYVHEWEVEKKHANSINDALGLANKENERLQNLLKEKSQEQKPVVISDPKKEEVILMESKKYSLNKNDLKKIGKGLLIALAGTTLTYITEYVTKVDFGAYTPVVVSVWSVIANTASKFLAGK